MSDDKEDHDKLLNLLLKAIEKDNELRKEYEIGEKFRFIRDRLAALKTQVEQNIHSLEKKQKKVVKEIGEDETLVYVYLYNAQGANTKTWLNLVNPTAFYEYSVNRPIYAEKAHIEEYLRTKTNKAQHGYIAIIIKKNNVRKSEDMKDSLNHPLIKVKEGSFKVEKLLFMHINKDNYLIDSDGNLVKK